jgi:hypothetical protein
MLNRASTERMSLVDVIDVLVLHKSSLDPITAHCTMLQMSPCDWMTDKRDAALMDVEYEDDICVAWDGKPK